MEFTEPRHGEEDIQTYVDHQASNPLERPSGRKILRPYEWHPNDAIEETMTQCQGDPRLH